MALLLLLSGWMAATGCRKSEVEETGSVVFTLQAEPFPAVTKSVLSAAAETKITSCLLAVYRDGRLEWVRSRSDGGPLEASLPGGGSRKAYAFVNMASLQEKDLPAQETDLPSVSWQIGSYAGMEEDGLPMAGIVESVPDKGTCPVVVTRLVSRFDFHLLDGYKSFFDVSPRVQEHRDDPSWLLQNICYTLRNINGTLHPFGVSVAGPGDLLEDREFDLTLDGNAVLYVPENRQGKLLDNDNPARKDQPALLEKYGGDYQVCASFVEVSLKQDPSRYGVGGDLKYRFFLGEDSVSDFSVGRNRLYEVGFGPEYGTVMQCYDRGVWPWKVGSENWHDSRYLAFDAERYPVRKGRQAAVRVRYGFEGTDHPEVAGADWTLFVRDGEDLVPAASCRDLASVSIDSATGICSLQPDSGLAGGTQLELVARTRDGRHEARAVLAVLPDGELSLVWDRSPRYIAQKGRLSLTREGEAVAIASFSVPEGNDNVYIEKDGDGLQVSALRSGAVLLRIETENGDETEASLSIKVPVLQPYPGSLILSADASDNNHVTAYYRTTPEEGSVPLAVGGEDAFSLDRTLYERYLAPVVEKGTGSISPYLSVTDGIVYLASYPADLDAFFERSDAHALTVHAVACADIVPADIPVKVRVPFRGVDAGTILGVIRNCSVLGMSPWKKLSDGTAVYTGERTVLADGLTLVPYVANYSFEDSGQFSFSLDEATGKLALQPSAAGGYSAGKVAVTAIVRNARTGATCRVPVGVVESYLYTQVGGVFRDGNVSAGLWDDHGVQAFRDLRTVLSSRISIRPDFPSGSFRLRNTSGNNVWTRYTEESLEGTYQLSYESDASLMSSWREAKAPGRSYALGETVYSVDLNPNMATVQEYSYSAMMVWRTTGTLLSYSLSSGSGFSRSDLGWHYAWDSERDAFGRPYYVLNENLFYFMQTDTTDD